MDPMSTLQSNLNMSLIYNLRTGNIIVDSLISVLVTSLIMYALSLIRDSGHSLKTWIPSFWRKKRSTLTITCSRYTSKNSDGNVEQRYLRMPYDKSAQDMIDGIRKYITDNHPECITQAELIPASSKDDSNVYTTLKTRAYNAYMSETSICVPYKDGKIWVTFRKDQIARDKKDISIEEVSMVILESDKDLATIREWREMCYDYWVETYFKSKDVHPLYYNQLRGVQRGIPYYRGFVFETCRTFDRIFFDQKEEFLLMLDNFINKQGIYAQNHLPYRLNLLLHGIVGSGKTSLIKALANRTHRHIIHINLPLIKTNHALMEVLHSDTIQIRESDSDRNREVTIPHNKRIYVLEDVDAMSDIVHDRSLKKEKLQEKEQRVVIMMKDVKDGNDEMALDDESDRLNLSGILNVFDGILELTGSILIMTTNHIEKLDPALIRPGRMNLQIHLDKMSLHSLSEMLSAFYQTKVSIDRLKEQGLQDKMYTPAKYEQVMMLSPTIDDFFNKVTQLNNENK